MAATTLARAAVSHALPQLNTLTKYPSILTLHALGERGRLTEALTTPAVLGQAMLATEKVDGTNCRLLVFADGSYVIGSREHLLHVSGDLLFDPAVGIVEGLRRTVLAQHPGGRLATLVAKLPEGTPAPLTVVYGEFYGGRVTASSRHYGPPETVGFRAFDAAVFTDAAALHQHLTADVRELAAWREYPTPEGLRYGQPFLPAAALADYLAQAGLPAVPALPPLPLPAAAADLGPGQVLAWLRERLPHTAAALDPATAPGKAEGLILRSPDRRHIVKLRFEDYEKTLQPRGPK